MYKKPVDKYDGVICKNKYPAHRVKGQIHEFGNNLVNFQYYYQNHSSFSLSPSTLATRNFVCRLIKNNKRYEIYQTGYLIGCLGPIPWVDLGEGASPK